MKKIRKFSGTVEVQINIRSPEFYGIRDNLHTAYVVLITESPLNRGLEINDKIFPAYVNRMDFFPESNPRKNGCKSSSTNDIIKLFQELKLTEIFLNQSWGYLLIPGSPTITVKLAIDSSHPNFPNDGNSKLFVHILRRSLTDRTRASFQNTGEIDFGGGYFKFNGTKQEENICECFVAIDFGNHSTVADLSFQNSTNNQSYLVKRGSVVALKGPIAGKEDSKITRLCFGNDFDENEEFYSRNGIPVWTGRSEEKGLQLFGANEFVSAHKFPKRALCHPDSYIDLADSPGSLVNIQDSSLEIMPALLRPDGTVRKKYALPKRLPAELFLFDFLERISAVEIPGIEHERVGTPVNIVLTYPTTYMIDEIQKFRKSFIRAYLRRLDIKRLRLDDESIFNRDDFCFGNDPILKTKIKSAIEDLESKNPKIETINNRKSVVSKMLDEASAAAYFYIKNNLLSEFGLKGFRLLHPEGCRIVIVDCGAGTTDVAAFDIIVEGANEKLKMNVTLSKLTGDQLFCGDFITMQIARFIKAKILHEALSYLSSKDAARDSDKARHLINALNQTRMTLDNFINRHYEALEICINGLIELVPGINCNYQLINETNTADKSIFLSSLIDEAERIKQNITFFSSQKNDSSNKRPDKVKLSSPFLKVIPNSFKELQEKCAKIEISFEDIDQLIEEQLNQLCKAINNSILIPSDDEKSSKVVQQIILTGKGSLYPYIAKYFRENLAVVSPDNQIKSLKDLLPNFNKEDQINLLKNCVSIGARMWLEDSMSTSVEVDFKNNLLEELPFDVFVDDPLTNSKRLLYKVQTKYTDLYEEKIKENSDQVVWSPDQGIKDLYIYKRYPGSIHFETYMLFSWKAPAKKIRVFWDMKKMCFGADSEDGAKPESSKRIYSGEDYFDSPLWSGKI